MIYTHTLHVKVDIVQYIYKQFIHMTSSKRNRNYQIQHKMFIHQFFIEFLFPFQLLGFASPLKYPNQHQKIVKLFIIAIISITYWIGIAFVLERHLTNTDKVSQISNYIQLCVNSIAIACIIGYPYVKIKLFKSILDGFCKIDSKLSYFDYITDLRQFRKTFMCYCIPIAFNAIYDCFVNYETNPIWYWIVTYTPIIGITFGLVQVNFFIKFVCKRFLKVEHFLDNLLINYNSLISFKIGTTAIITGLPPKAQSNYDNRDLEEKLKFVYDTIIEIAEVTHKIEDLFGPLLFSTFAAIFTTSAIQGYYICYFLTFYNSLEKPPYTKIIPSILMVVTNSGLMILTANICDNLTGYVSNAI